MTNTYQDIVADNTSASKWYMAELEQGKICYIHNRILTLWKVKNDDTLKVLFKKDIGSNIPKEVVYADYVHVKMIEVSEEVCDYHKFANNFFQRKQDPLEAGGPRGGKTTFYTLKTGEQKHRFNILLNDSVYRQLIMFAEEQQISRNQLVSGILENDLKMRISVN